MTRALALGLFVTLLWTHAGRADQPVGLEPGATPAPFEVVNVTGKKCQLDHVRDEREKLCYRCKLDSNPVVCVFSRKVNRSTVSLVKALDAEAGRYKDQKLSVFVVFLTNKPEAFRGRIDWVQRRTKCTNVPLTMWPGKAGPEAYQLRSDDELTVLMWKDLKVSGGLAYQDAALTEQDVTAVVSRVKSLVDG